VIGPLQQVHLRFNDAAGQQAPVRLRVTDADGRYFAPFGRLTHFATEPGVDVGANVLTDDGPWAIIDGACEIALPPGRLRVQARKGPEYRALDADLVLQPGKMSFRFTMERWTNLAGEGWHSGDTCCYEMSPHAAMLEAMVNDVSVVDLLVRESSTPGPPRLVNIAAYSGQQPALARPGHLVVVNTANQSPHGRLLLLNTHRAVYPLSFQAGEKWSLIDWCDQCHRKKGLVVADDWLPRLANGPVPELLDPEFLRRVDAIRFHPGVPLTPWFEALDRGFHLPLVAGSGKDSNRAVLGLWRAYAKLPPGQPLDYAAWTEAIRAGRTFVTNGPILRLESNNNLVAEASSDLPLDRLELISHGEIIAATAGPATKLRLEATPASWTIARCTARDGAMAIASPTTARDRD
jgi:hypothetical protein